mmetsp:Transcript_14832/g.21175  ORF Transcript_14832/g.21175 Transcript_14832/m.21175 type:complete len:443 (-) Transcript_14832:50-1378(-)
MSGITFKPTAKLNFWNELHELINNVGDNEWAEVIARLRTHPQEVSVQGRYGHTALHLSCYRYPPTTVVRAILEAAPGITALQDGDGETPLHLALGFASEEVQLLLIQDSLDAVCKVNNNGDTPLHLAVISGASTRVLRMLIQLNPYAVLQSNGSSRTPFDNLRRSYKNATTVEDIQTMSDGCVSEDWHNALVFLISASWLYGFQMSPSNIDYYEPCLLAGTEMCYYVTPYTASYRCYLLHIATWVNCPRSIAKTFSIFYPDQCLALDSFGNTPLCLAASAPVWKFVVDYVDESDDSIPEEAGGIEESIIEILLSANPNAASIPNRKGRLPLAVALEAGKQFDAILPIIQAYPRALETRDTATKLYPFMIAAASNYSLHGASPESFHRNEELSTLNTVFKLILMLPELVNIASFQKVAITSVVSIQEGNTKDLPVRHQNPKRK